MYHNCNYKNPNQVYYDALKENRSKKFRFCPGACFGHHDGGRGECRKCGEERRCAIATDSEELKRMAREGFEKSDFREVMELMEKTVSTSEIKKRNPRGEKEGKTETRRKAQ